jgi:hypothetical protein
MGVNMLIYFYECNLRANIVKVEYEKAIITEDDLYNAGRDLYIPFGSTVDSYYRLSVIPIKRKLYKRAVERSTLFPYVNGAMLMEDMTRLVETGEYEKLLSN